MSETRFVSRTCHGTSESSFPISPFIALVETDLHMIKGDWTVLSPLPCVLGHEGSGIVIRCGKGVKNFREGDHVVTIFQKNCGRSVSKSYSPRVMERDGWD